MTLKEIGVRFLVASGLVLGSSQNAEAFTPIRKACIGQDESLVLSSKIYPGFKEIHKNNGFEWPNQYPKSIQVFPYVEVQSQGSYPAAYMEKPLNVPVGLVTENEIKVCIIFDNRSWEIE